MAGDRFFTDRDPGDETGAPWPHGRPTIAQDSAFSPGASRSEIVALNANARRIVADALARYDGPCPHAYADVISSYVSAPPGGRDALFLAVARQAVGVTPPNPTSASCSRPTDDSALRPLTDPELLAWGRSTLGLLARLSPQERS